MKNLKEIVGLLKQIVPLVVGAQDGGPGSGQKGHTTAEQNATRQVSALSRLENRSKAITGHKNASAAYREAQAAQEKANLARIRAKNSGDKEAHASAQIEFENTKRALGNAAAKKDAAFEKKNPNFSK